MSHQILFDLLWKEYAERNPHALEIYQLVTQRGETVINDHIALRTFNDSRINIEQLAKFFKVYGYQECGTYHFPAKKLFAKHYEHEDPSVPKVFISELLAEQFSPRLQAIVKKCVDKIPHDLLNSEELLYAGTFWKPLSYQVYQELLTESEYAAWMYVFGFCANHFTVNVNALTTFSELNDVNEFLLRNGFKLNISGGAIKGSPQEYLEQSSTLAEQRDITFSEGTHRIPSCYYEFAKRYHLPNGKLYTGFIATSADKIFESTDVNIQAM